MSLKYNSRTALESKLAILKCCIGTKAIEVSDSIALALGNVDCKIQELEILQSYYDALQCYYPFDCWTLTGCTDTFIPETITFLITETDLDTIAQWFIDDNVVYYNIYSYLTGTIYPLLHTGPAVFNDIETYINNNPNLFGYSMSWALTVGGINVTLTTLSIYCNSPVLGTWGFDFFNQTLDDTISYNQTFSGSATCGCEETCCNIKVTPEILDYTLVTPQSLETKTIILSGDQCLSIGTALFTSDIINFKIYNLLTGAIITIPYIYTPPIIGASNIFNASKLALEYIQNYINTNSAALGYTMGLTSVFVSSNNCTFTIVLTTSVCSQSTGSNLWGFIVYDVTTSTNIETSRLKGYTPLGTSTCSVYSSTSSRPEFIECIENCITDEEAEKMIRHALSLCECCIDIEINNEPFN